MAQLSKEDAKSAFDTSGVEIESIGPSGEEKFEEKTLSMPERRKRAAHAAYTMHNVPKKWRGGGDYFFEVVAPGKLRITGGDKAKSLTGGKSVVITDRSKISEIFEKARQGDILEEGVSYEATAQEAAPPRMRGDSPPAAEEAPRATQHYDRERTSVGGQPESETAEAAVWYPPEEMTEGVRLEGESETAGFEGERHPESDATRFLNKELEKAKASGNEELASQYIKVLGVLRGLEG